MKHKFFSVPDWHFDKAQRAELAELLKLDDAVTCKLLDRTEHAVALYLGRLEGEDPGLSPGGAKKLEAKIERTTEKLLGLFEDFEPYNANVRVRESLLAMLGFTKSHDLIDRLLDDLLHLKIALEHARNTASPTPRGRPVQGIDLTFVSGLARSYADFSGRTASKYPQSIFYRFTKRVLEFAGQPRSDVRELIGIVIGKPKKR